ncbi:MAG: serine/threonine-protein kinase [Nocardioides sp.]|uniref:serine/threonine-protein kinase n=1 Tax=Nocardioides sp. TaxID=35761 RepID=UPI0039E42F76
MSSHFGRYAVQRRIGAGGFATVWLAYDAQLDSPVAVKVLADNWAGDGHVRRRFLEEGRYLRRVESPHVVTVYDAGELDDGRPYLVMTYADQGTLADRVDIGAGPGEASGLTLPQSMVVVRQIADGLQALHDRDVLHRDVKPANVLFRSINSGTDVRAMLGDLGLGKALDMSSRLTMVGGTPSYVAPEQAAAEPVDARADQYSLAALAYLLLAGRPAFRHNDLAAAAEPGPVPALSTEERPFADAVEEVLRRGLSVDREERYPSVTVFADALSTALQETTGELPAVTRPGRPWLPIDSDLTLPGVGPTRPPLPPAAAGPSGPDRPATPNLAGIGACGPGGSGDSGGPEPERAKTRRPRRGRRIALGAGIVLLGVAAGTGAYALTPKDAAKPPDQRVHDATGVLSITVPSGWDTYESVSGWRPPNNLKSTDPYPAISVGTSQDWNNASMVASGAFLTLIPGVTLPARLPGHPACTAAAPVSDTDDAGHARLTGLYTDCPGGVVIERMVQVNSGELLWVQVHAEDEAEAEAEEVLGSITVAE